MSVRPARLIAVALLAGLAGCGPGDAGAGDPPEWNVVFLTVDTLRADHLGCYGYPRDTSPFLDSLAAESTFFEHAIVNWPKTGPSFASLFTSMYGSTTGVMRKTGTFAVPEVLETFTEALQEVGYQTLGVVSNSSLSREFHYHQGFEKYEEAFTIDVDAAEEITTVAKRLLEERDPDRPFFLWAHYIDPHTPYHAPEGYEERFRGDALYQQDTRPAVQVEGTDPEHKGAASVRCIPRSAYLEGRAEVRDYQVAYDAEIRYLDDVLQGFFAWLDEQGLREHTIVVFTSDHGESLGDHEYYFEHGRYPYDACSRVPLFFQVPGAPPARIPEPVALLDVAPTLLAALDLAPHPSMEGRSLLDWVRAGRAQGEVRPVITESGYKERYCVAYREGPWKLVYVGDESLQQELGGQPYELYQVLDDPGETRNLADAEPGVMARLRPILDREVEQRYARKGLAQAIEAGEDVQAMLRKLGYVDGQ